jgi:hypothetical protein
MSQTASVDVVSRSYWTYVASRMVEGLDRLLAGDRDQAVIPRRVCADAQEFLRLALEGSEDVVTQNPPASISNYLIAAGAVRATADHAGGDRVEVRAALRDYADFVGRLSTNQPGDAFNDTTAQELRGFFRQLQQEGEDEAYDKVVHFEMPHISRRQQSRP